MLSRRGLLTFQRCQKPTIRNEWIPIAIHRQVRNLGNGSVQASNADSIEQSKKGVTPQKRPIVRTLFYVPGSSQKMIDKAWTLTPDNIVFPLYEDHD
jgi:hypothetical protein